nr:AAA family ATPase [uncultured Cardiobacterium sp.]
MNDDTASTFNHQPAMTFANGAHGITLNPPPPQQAGHCMDVWVVCESLRQTDGTLPTKAQALADARLAQSNRNNVEQEYYRWRRWRSGGSSSLSGSVNPAAFTFHTGDNNMEKPPKKIPFTNTIYYGPPGTGKTYRLSQLLEGYTRPAPSNLNQEEKLDIWRQEFIKNNISNLAWWKVIVAVLIHLDRGARIDEILEHKFIKERAPNGKINAPNVWNSLAFHAVDNLPNINIKTRHKPIVFEKDNEGIWSLLKNAQENCKDAYDFFESYENGFPPDWNPETSEVLRNYKVVTFHQSYGYEEFVEGLRPVLSDKEDKEDSEETEGDKTTTVRYEIRDGIFKELCNEARKAPKQRFAIIIDEINRGNISKIFGELITLIEADKREGTENAISVKLPYSGEDFSIPQNVDIIGTMNTADRSLAVLDTALRRRFAFVEMIPDYKVLKDITVDGIKMDELLRRLNERIEILYDRDHIIGHAYFIPLRDQPTLEHLEQIFQQRIIPLLQEYFFDDWEKIRLVLGDNQKAKEEHQFIKCEENTAGEIKRLFGDKHPLGDYGIKPRYVINENAFREIEAYRGIYQPSAAQAGNT